MISIKCDKIDLNLVGKLKAQYPNQELLLVIKNTKGQSAEMLKEIGNKYSNITVSVLGGLNPEKKKKFDYRHYQERTYFSPSTLSKIIKVYESIERKIDISWTDTQKAMFAYRELGNHMIYSELNVNGIDWARGIGGLLFGKAVCSGFAMIYAELLDRLGIENYYQNQSHSHSWNVAKLDGKYRGIDLTWDVAKKDENGCDFRFFGQDANFYNHKYHNIDGEREETKFPLVPFTKEELIENFRVISRPRVIRIPTQQKWGINNSQKFAFVTYNGDKEIKCVGHTEEKAGRLELHCNQLSTKSDYKSFKRDDGSNFILVRQNQVKGLNKYLIIQPDKDCVKISYIYSDMNLINHGEKMDKLIANELLSEERLKKKINRFNGYVGYIGQNAQRYYDDVFEQKELNIIDR